MYSRSISGLKIVEMCGYESDGVRGVSNLKPVTDELRAARTIRQEFSSERATRTKINSDKAITRGSQAVACEQQATA